MSWSRVLIILALILFIGIGIVAYFKSSSKPSTTNQKVIQKVTNAKKIAPIKKKEVDKGEVLVKKIQKKELLKEPVKKEIIENKLPESNRIDELFNTKGVKSPIVETITYKSRVDWQKGRPAWISDYARQYNTSRHFIARSLNGKADYLKQDVSEGDRFNVFKPEKNIEFYLVADISRNKLWFFYDDLNTKEQILIKTYPLCLGRLDSTKTSGSLTPVGTYSLGNKTAVYKIGSKGNYRGEHIDMITVFGTRWIPFDKELSNCSAPSKGLGMHGLPWSKNSKGEWIQEKNSIGKYESDGCIRMNSEDIEELYSIIISRPTTIEIVKDFFEAKHVQK